MPATMLVHPEELRPLSIQEYARVQQFPDDWVFEGKPIKIYKQIGNAVPVGLGLMAGNTIKAHMTGTFPESTLLKTSRYNRTRHTEFLEDFVMRNGDNEDLQTSLIDSMGV